jgi:hypothetical protein
VDLIQNTHTLTDADRDLDLKQHLLLGSARSLNEALNQALKLKAVKAAARTPAMQQGVRAKPQWECGCHQMNTTGMDDLYTGSMGILVTFRKLSADLTRSPTIKNREKICNRWNSGMKRCQYHHPQPLISHFCLIRTDNWKLTLELW